jgi:hypothetical protein
MGNQSVARDMAPSMRPGMGPLAAPCWPPSPVQQACSPSVQPGAGPSSRHYGSPALSANCRQAEHAGWWSCELEGSAEDSHARHGQRFSFTLSTRGAW